MPFNFESLTALADQLVPTGGSAFGGGDNPLQAMQALGFQPEVLDQPLQISPEQLRPAPEEISGIDEAQAKNVKGFAKAVGNIGDILSNPAVLKALGSVGIGLDPRGVGGVLGSLGINLSEAEARRQFREQLEEGAEPGQVSVAGLSVEGREAEETAFQRSKKLAQEEARAKKALELEERGVTVREEELELRTDQLGLEREISTSKEERERAADANKVRLDDMKVALEKDALKLEGERNRYQNMLDAARAEALRTDAKRGETDIFKEVNQVRLDLIDKLTEDLDLLQNEDLRDAERALETYDNDTSGFPGKFKSDERVKKEAQGRAERVQVMEGIKRKIQETEQFLEELKGDIGEDVSGRSDFVPVGTNNIRTSGRGEGRLLKPSSPAQARSIPDYVRYQVVDKGVTKVVMNTPGGTFEVQ